MIELIELVRQARRNDREQRLAEERQLYERMQQVELFPGTLEEYERLKRHPYEIIDVLGQNKFLAGYANLSTFQQLRYKGLRIGPFVLFNARRPLNDLLKEAVELDAEAIVRYTTEQQPSFMSGREYVYQTGIPVRRRLIGRV